MNQRLLFASLSLAGKKTNPKSLMFYRLWNASFSCVANEKKKTNSATGLKIGCIPDTFSKTISGGVEPSWAGRTVTSAAAFSSDDAFMDSSELGSSWTFSYTLLKKSYLVSLWHFDVRLIARSGVACCFSPFFNRLFLEQKTYKRLMQTKGPHPVVTKLYNKQVIINKPDYKQTYFKSSWVSSKLD